MEGTSFEEDWAVVAAGSAMLRRMLGRWHQVGSDRLGPMFAELDELKMLADAGQVGLLDEGVSRGDVRASDAASPAGWVRQWGGSYVAGGAAQLVTVVEAISQPRNGLLRQAVLSARVPVRNAAVAICEMDKLRPRLTPALHDAVLEGFVDLAQAQGPGEIRKLRPSLIARYGRAEEFQRREDKLKHGNALSQPYADDGMREYRLRLDPEGSAVLEAILGPLAAPQPSSVNGSDLRTSDQRRAEALVEICRRAAEAGGSAPATAKAVVFVTMDWTDLKNRTGAGTTVTGELLAPETVRRIACDASIVPVVLGSNSEVLNLGRTTRLATPKMLQALWIRDKGCTFPGCSRPPAWCDAHHVVSWCNGGPTDLGNMALLCPRHHTIVHQKRYTATVTGFAATWHL